jgi:hypothetical protein
MGSGNRNGRTQTFYRSHPTASAREISSRSASVSARAGGVAGPAGCRRFFSQNPCTDEWFRSKSWAIFWRDSLSANVPTSAPSASRCNKSGVAVSSATLPLLAQSSVCCIHRLNPPPFTAVRHRPLRRRLDREVPRRSRNRPTVSKNDLCHGYSFPEWALSTG